MWPFVCGNVVLFQCACTCVCACVCVFTQLEVESRITSPGGVSWAVCSNPIKSSRVWHPLQQTRGPLLPKYPHIRAQKAGQIPTNPSEFT